MLSDAFGRVSTIQIASFAWVVGSVVSVFVVDIGTLIAGRSIKGIAVGILSASIVVYVMELLPANKRGLGTSTLQWCLTWGIMIMFYLSYLCLNLEEDGSFRVAWAVEGLPGLMLLFLGFILPESPKWYASKGKWLLATQTMDSLKLAWSTKDEIPDQVIHANLSLNNLNNIEGVLNQFENHLKKCSYRDLLGHSLRYHLIAGITTQCVVQLSGIGVLMYYLVFICEMIGLQGDSKILSASVQYVINVIFTIIPILWLDKMRRKDVLVYGAVSLGLCNLVIGVIMGAFGHPVLPVDGNESIVWEIKGTPGSICLAFCFLFVAIFASSLSCAAWLYTNEILPSKAKVKGSAICMSFSWSLNFLLTFLAPLLLSTIKWGTFILFGAFCICGALFMGFYLPETYGLDETLIENVFDTAYEVEFEDIELKDRTKTLVSATPSHHETSSKKRTSPAKPSPTHGTDSPVKSDHSNQPKRTSPSLSNEQRTGYLQSLDGPSKVLSDPHTPLSSPPMTSALTERGAQVQGSTPSGYYNMGSANSLILNDYDTSAYYS